MKKMSKLKKINLKTNFKKMGKLKKINLKTNFKKRRKLKKINLKINFKKRRKLKKINLKTNFKKNMYTMKKFLIIYYIFYNFKNIAIYDNFFFFLKLHLFLVKKNFNKFNVFNLIYIYNCQVFKVFPIKNYKWLYFENLPAKLCLIPLTSIRPISPVFVGFKSFKNKNFFLFKSFLFKLNLKKNQIYSKLYYSAYTLNKYFYFFKFKSMLKLISFKKIQLSLKFQFQLQRNFKNMKLYSDKLSWFKISLISMINTPLILFQNKSELFKQFFMFKHYCPLYNNTCNHMLTSVGFLRRFILNLNNENKYIQFVFLIFSYTKLLIVYNRWIDFFNLINKNQDFAFVIKIIFNYRSKASKKTRRVFINCFHVMLENYYCNFFNFFFKKIIKTPLLDLKVINRSNFSLYCLKKRLNFNFFNLVSRNLIFLIFYYVHLSKIIDFIFKPARNNSFFLAKFHFVNVINGSAGLLLPKVHSRNSLSKNVNSWLYTNKNKKRNASLNRAEISIFTLVKVLMYRFSPFTSYRYQFTKTSFDVFNWSTGVVSYFMFKFVHKFKLVFRKSFFFFCLTYLNKKSANFKNFLLVHLHKKIKNVNKKLYFNINIYMSMKFKLFFVSPFIVYFNMFYNIRGHALRKNITGSLLEYFKFNLKYNFQYFAKKKYVVNKKLKSPDLVIPESGRFKRTFVRLFDLFNQRFDCLGIFANYGFPYGHGPKSKFRLRRKKKKSIKHF